MPERRSSILIRGARILNPGRDDRAIRDVLIEGDIISEIASEIPSTSAESVIDASGHVLMPGLINAHTHAHNNLTKGAGDNWTLEDLRNHGSALYANRTPDDQYLAAAIGAIEMLKSGCTSAYEQFIAVPIHTSDGISAVMQAYKDVGIRAVIAPAVSDSVLYHSIPGLMALLPEDLRRHVEVMHAAPARELLALSERAVREWHGVDNGRIQVALAPVIAGECSDELWIGCNALAKGYGLSLHTHLLETKIQAIGSLQKFGKSLVERLSDLDVLGSNLVCGHSIWVGHQDIRRLADGGCKVAHNPASNLKLGSGLAPVREMLDQGIVVGIGTDGSMSSDNQNMFEAMRFAALISKVRFPHWPDRWLSAGEVFDMATVGGSSLLGLDGRIGKVEAGLKADLTLLRKDSVYLRPMSNLTQSAVYCETGADVDTVIVDGKIVVEHGKLLTVDENKIFERAQSALERLMKQNAPSRELSRRIEPFLRCACRACAEMPFKMDRYARAVDRTAAEPSQSP